MTEKQPVLNRNFPAPKIMRRPAVMAATGLSRSGIYTFASKADRDSGRTPGVPSDVAGKMKALERENHEIRQANEILRKASACFAPLSAIPCIACRATGRNSTADTGHDRLHRRSARSSRELAGSEIDPGNQFPRQRRSARVRLRKPPVRESRRTLIAPSTCHAHVAKRVDPSRLSARDRRGVVLRQEVKRVAGTINPHRAYVAAPQPRSRFDLQG